MSEAVARNLKPHLAEVAEAVREAVADVSEPERPGEERLPRHVRGDEHGGASGTGPVPSTSGVPPGRAPARRFVPRASSSHRSGGRSRRQREAPTAYRW